MCGIAAVAGVAQMGLGIAQSVAGYNAQKQDFKNNKLAAQADQENQGRQLTLRQIQEEEASGTKHHQVALDGAARAAQAQVAGDAAGAAGLSMDAVLNDVDRATSTNLDTIDRNAHMTAQRLQQEQDDLVTKTEGRINSVQKPSKFGLVAGIAGSVLGGASAFKSAGGSFPAMA